MNNEQSSLWPRFVILNLLVVDRSRDSSNGSKDGDTKLCELQLLLDNPPVLLQFANHLEVAG